MINPNNRVNKLVIAITIIILFSPPFFLSKLNKSNSCSFFSLISLLPKESPNPNKMPNRGAPIDPDKAISAYPERAKEVLTIKSGRELPKARTVILRKD